MDYKLFWLRFAKKIWLVVAATILGALLVGGPYYFVNITIGEGPSYKIVSEYYLDYAEDSSGALYDYFNYYTWSEITDTDEFIGILKAQLPEEMFASEETLRQFTDATVESDTRYLTTTVQTEHPDKTVIIARAMENAILKFALGQKEFSSVKVVTAPLEAEETYPDVRPVRAVILGAVLGLFIGIVGVCVYIICDSSVYLPNMFEKRYGVKALGCISFAETKNNIRYLTKDAKNLAVVGLGDLENKQANAALEYIKETIGETSDIVLMNESILAEGFEFEKLREYEGAVFLVKAGAKNGKKIERAVEQMRRQDVNLTGAFLFDEDKTLIKRYYR
ncbi:MAG: hypothetical protein IJ274_09730 [Lachnospiraceae bacterium]|nr:hypothetical protein [Lachnospiraceae bacterium]